MKRQLSFTVVGFMCCGSLMAMSKNPTAPTLNDYRAKITNIDQEIIDLIAKRDNIVKEVGKYKKVHKLNVYDPEREAKLKKVHTAMAIKSGVSLEVVDNVFDAIFTNSKNLERKI